MSLTRPQHLLLNVHNHQPYAPQPVHDALICVLPRQQYEVHHKYQYGTAWITKHVLYSLVNQRFDDHFRSRQHLHEFAPRHYLQVKRYALPLYFYHLNSEIRTINISLRLKRSKHHFSARITKLSHHLEHGNLIDKLRMKIIEGK